MCPSAKIQGVPRPDLIKVSENGRTEIAADRADLFVTIRGSSLVTGREALKRAREVSALVADLAAYGIDESSVFVQGVHAEVSSGLLGRSSSARYALKVRCARLDTLPDVLGIVTGQKTASLDRVEWGYGDTSDAKERLATECLARAARRAERIAEGLGVRLLGVHTYGEQLADTESPYAITAPQSLQAKSFRGAPARMTSEDLGLEVSHFKTLEIRVDVEYRISGFDAAS